MKVEDLLPEKYRDQASDYEKGMDTMDVWFDSGIIRLHRLDLHHECTHRVLCYYVVNFSI
jgi:isoleucyl-tRNA synthetase